MGAAVSQQKLIEAQGQLLEDFVGAKSWEFNNPFWQELLSFPVPLTKLPPQGLEAAALPYCEALVRNNQGTHNLQTLLEHLLQKLQTVDTPEGAQAATNAVVFARIFLKYSIESLNADDLVALLDAPIRAAKAKVATSNGTVTSWVVLLVNATVGVLTTVKVRDSTYLLHLETMHLLLVLVSTQLYSPIATAEPGAHPFTEVLMDSPEAAKQLLLVLLQHFIERRPLPPRAPMFVPPPTAQNRGVLRLVRSAAASVLWLPIQALTFLVRSGNQQLAESPLCDTGLLLLLVLLHHAPASGHNAFQRALQPLEDANPEREDEDSAPSFSDRTDRVDFARLYEALGKNLTNERSVLLLYDLLHTCPQLLNFVIVKTDIDVILQPLLQMLYTVVGRSASQMYMLLIVILILSQDPRFSSNMHGFTLPSVPWYSERLLKDMPLGSLLVVVLLRTAHYNLSKLKDVYLHTNTLAALANLAPYMSNLSSHAAQRLVSLFDMLARRYMRLTRWAEEGKATEAIGQETQVYYDFLRIVLEILNCIIVRGLHKNPELVYALLHRQDVFTPFQAYPQFTELLENVQLVISFFNERIDATKADRAFEWSVPKVLEVVKANLGRWPGQQKLRQFPELRFTYEQEASPEGFFVPYVWTLAVTHTTVPWRPQAIALFSPVATADDATAGGGLETVAVDHEMASFASGHENGPPSAADNV